MIKHIHDITSDLNDFTNYRNPSQGVILRLDHLLTLQITDA